MKLSQLRRSPVVTLFKVYGAKAISLLHKQHKVKLKTQYVWITLKAKRDLSVSSMCVADIAQTSKPFAEKAANVEKLRGKKVKWISKYQ